MFWRQHICHWCSFFVLYTQPHQVCHLLLGCSPTVHWGSLAFLAPRSRWSPQPHPTMLPGASGSNANLWFHTEVSSWIYSLRASFWPSTGLVETQGKPPLNVPQWHIDYSDLNLLDKQLVPDGHHDPPLSPWIPEINLLREG